MKTTSLKNRIALTTMMFSLASLSFVSCSKDETEIEPIINKNSSQIWLLNEGSWSGNDAELSLIDMEKGTIANNYFEQANQRRMGDLAQDAIIYGSKLYVSLYGSGVVQVVNSANGRSLGTVNLNGIGPRCFAAYNGKIYASCYTPNSIAVIDTATLQLDTIMAMPFMRPEGIAISGNKLYVCSAWGYTSNSTTVYDDKLYILSLPRCSIVDSITVGSNPNVVAAIDPTHIAVAYWGNYNDLTGGLAIINTDTKDITQTSISATKFDYYNGYLYTFSYDYYTTPHTHFYRVDATTGESEEILQTLAGKIVYPYSIHVNDNDLYITDARNFTENGDIYRVHSDGTEVWKAETTMGPLKVLFK